MQYPLLLHVPSKPGSTHTCAAFAVVHFLLQYDPWPPLKQALLAHSPSEVHVSRSALPLPPSVPPSVAPLLLELEEPPDDDVEEEDEPPELLEELLPEPLEPPELLLLEDELLLLSGSLEHPCAASRARATTVAGRTVRRYFMPPIVST